MTIRTASGALGIAAATLFALVAALLLASPVAAAGTQTLTATASTTNVNPGQSFTLTITQNATVATSGEQTNVDFDHTRFQVTGVSYGADWSAGGVNQPIGVAPNNTVPLAIADANTTGHLRNVAAYYTPPTTVPSGARTFIVVTFQALANGGSSSITLSSASGIDGSGDPVGTTTSSTADVFINGPISVGGIVETVIPHDGGSSMSLWMILLGVAGAVAVVGGLGLVGRKVRSEARG
jgi:hypothetical protein